MDDYVHAWYIHFYIVPSVPEITIVTKNITASDVHLMGLPNVTKNKQLKNVAQSSRGKDDLFVFCLDQAT